MVETHHFDAIDSTNKEAHRIVKTLDDPRRDLKSGILITADAQTQGIGRENRRWYSQQNGGLYYTLLLAPRPLATEDLSELSLSVAREVAEVVTEISDVSPTLKWPNDLLVNGRKLCGVLIDCLSKSGEQHPYAMVIGIGLNLNQSIFPDELDHIATSLYLETGKHHNKDAYVSRITRRLLDLLADVS